MKVEKDKLINPFSSKRVKGKKATVSIGDVLSAVLGDRPTHGSKRLAPPMCVCNGRLYVGKKMVWNGDLDIYVFRHKVHMVADLFNCTIKLYREHGDELQWTSQFPNTWFGYCGKGVPNGQDIEKVIGLYVEMHREQVRNWCIDHEVKIPNAYKKKVSKKQKRKD